MAAATAETELAAAVGGVGTERVGAEASLGAQKSLPKLLPRLGPATRQAVAIDVDTCGWQPLDSLSPDENGVDLALLVARSSHCKAGSMGCVIAAPSGELLAVHVNGPMWDSVNSKRPASDVHAEVNALGLCARRGHATEGATAFVTMPPCKRCFASLAVAGVRRVVSRKPPAPQEAKDICVAAKRLCIDLVVVQDTEERRRRLDDLAKARIGGGEEVPRKHGRTGEEGTSVEAGCGGGEEPPAAEAAEGLGG
mmetsp:Transcript_24687/g.79972  ORF Transcript_24687/g.79972 Transcript_24687/m.79972 type:complete len:253 (-) Transcript_24687:14-772(-)